MSQNLLEYFKELLGMNQQDIELPVQGAEVGPTDINSILGKATSIGPNRAVPRAPDETLRSATSIGPPGINSPIRSDPSEEFLRRNTSIADIINELGLHPFENADRGIGSAAGLPFQAYAKKYLQRPYVTHGTQRPWEKIDYDRFDKGDVLGDWFHNAENPSYSNEYALGAKGTPIPEGYESLMIPSNLRPRSIPVVPEAQNILDLIDPNMDDISQAVAFASPSHRRELISKFKDARRLRRGFVESPSGLPPLDELSSKQLQTTPNRYLLDRLLLDSRHFPEGVSPENAPMHMLSENLRLTPEQRNAMPFDAIRYHDMEHKSLAVRPGTPIRSAFGAHLTDDPTPIRVIRSDKSGGGDLTLTENFGKPPVRDKWGTIHSSGYDDISDLDPYHKSALEAGEAGIGLPKSNALILTAEGVNSPQVYKSTIDGKLTAGFPSNWSYKQKANQINKWQMNGEIEPDEYHSLINKLTEMDEGISGSSVGKKLPWEQVDILPNPESNKGSWNIPFDELENVAGSGQNVPADIKYGDTLKFLDEHGEAQSIVIQKPSQLVKAISNFQKGNWKIKKHIGIGGHSKDFDIAISHDPGNKPLNLSNFYQEVMPGDTVKVKHPNGYVQEYKIDNTHDKDYVANKLNYGAIITKVLK